MPLSEETAEEQRERVQRIKREITDYNRQFWAEEEARWKREERRP